MFKAINKVIRSIKANQFRAPLQYCFGDNDKKANVPAILHDKNHRQKSQYLSNLYGIETKKHIFPGFDRKIELTQQEMRFYQKVSPNYVVALVRKVIDQSGEDNQKQTLFDRFYDVSIYCRIKYIGEQTAELRGLFKVKLETLEKVQIQNISPLENQVQQQQKNNIQEIQDDIQQERNQNQNQYSIKSLIKVNRKRKPKKKKKVQFYSVKVKKINQLPLVINPKLQMKFKYLIETYFDMYNGLNKRVGMPIIFNIIDCDRILDQIAMECSQWNVAKSQIQACLEAIDPEQKTQLVQNLLQKSKYYKSYYHDIEKAALANLRNKKLHEYYSEIMKITKQIIDGKKTKQLFLEKSTKDFLDKLPNDQIKKVFDAEVQKYQHIDQNSMEAGIVKAYIEELSKIPYGVKSQQKFDLQYARQVLDEEHYGMQDIKDTILQIIAVGKLKGTLQGKIFCFVGGPGLGKTTFAKSIAKALNRKFYNISLGGVTDSSVLKGHRRTYMGAYSGKIIEALKNCQTNNPVILLDQIDKMGSSYQGDPRSQLLQILDPNQNNSFIDNFVDVPVDLSNVLFICSANYEENISKPLLDRMDKIKLSSYTPNEKKQIFKKHLMRRGIINTGVKIDQFNLDDNVINKLIDQYSFGEPGVRHLQKSISKILEKVAYKLVMGEKAPIEINQQNMSEYVGNSYYHKRDHSKLGTGIAISLGRSAYGGRLTYIEAFKKSFLSKKEKKRQLLFTGSLGDVFKEAMNISYTYARNFLALTLGNKFLYQNEVHIHAPDGAAKKDGSTDSLTIATSLISLALGRKVKEGVAMTGELTLQGKILRTKSIKQKILVAKREKIKEVIVPYDNFTEVETLKPEIKQGITFHFVKQYSEVHKIVFASQALSAS